jgi:20S proteasome subunit beta 7
LSYLDRIGEYTVIGAGGDMSDWQQIQHILDQQVVQELNADDGLSLAPEHYHEFLARIMYERRSKSDPLWNSLVVGGHKNGKSYRFSLADI